jgi:hypothetical protein
MESEAATPPVAEAPQDVAKAPEEVPVPPSEPDDLAAAEVSPAAEPVPAEPPAPTFVYALGEIDFRFPNAGLEKEVAQVVGQTAQSGTPQRDAVLTAISDRRNRYLARGLCWTLAVSHLETYILVPRDPGDYDLLLEAVTQDAYGDGESPKDGDGDGESPKDGDGDGESQEQTDQRGEPGRRPTHVDLVIGARTGIAPPEMCNGLSVPVVVCDQIYSFPRTTLIESIPPPDSVTEADNVRQFRHSAGRFFDYVMHVADNTGATDEHRALNYLAVRYPRIYTAVTEQEGQNASLAEIEARPSAVSEVRRIVDVIFAFRHRQTDVVTKYLVRVDVSDMYPFLAAPLSPYYDVSRGE